MVEFRSASSKNTGRKKEEEESLVKYKSADNYVGRPKKKKKEYVVKHKSADMYVGRPNKWVTWAMYSVWWLVLSITSTDVFNMAN